MRKALVSLAISYILVFSSAFGILMISTATGVGAPAIIVQSHDTFSIKNSIIGAESENWGGYAITGASGKITSVKMSWIVPAVSCSLLTETYSAMWVGIDGFGTSTVEQTGTLSDCGLTGANYQAWYEFYPAGLATIPDAVSAGDIISAQVTYSKTSGIYTVQISDHTKSWTYKATGTVSGSEDGSAEWIVERPEVCNLLNECSLSSLADFGQAFSGPKYTSLPTAQSDVATISGKTGDISSFSSKSGDAVYEVTMISTNSPTYALATPSALQTGRSFSMQWDAAS